MVEEKARKDRDWAKYEGYYCKLIYEDGVEKDGTIPHMSIKKGVVDKVTKTHIILREEGKQSYTGINLLKILRIEMEPNKKI